MTINQRFRAGAFLATYALITAAPVTAQTITFANIADNVTTNGGTLVNFDTMSVNSAGVVAFRAGLNTGRPAIFTNTGGSNTATLVADTTTTQGGAYFNVEAPTINTAGTVAFRAVMDTGVIRIVNGAGVVVADTSVTNGGAFLDLAAPRINDNGNVAFRAVLDAGGNAIFTNTAGSGSASIIANTTTTNGGTFESVNTPSINNAGVVAFFASRGTGNTGIFINTAGSPTANTVADTVTTNGGAFSAVGSPSINNAGVVAFFAARDAGGSGIFTNTAGSSTASLIADTTTTNGGAFSFFTEGNINNVGTVAFRAALDAGGEGIFAALSGGGAPISVLQTGDALFGSTVARIGLDSFDVENAVSNISDDNHIAFTYRLADGRRGIAVAQITAPVVVPEAGTLALAAVWLLAGVAIMVRRRTSR